MNARIIELAKESGIDIYGLGKDREKWEQCLQSFAELISNDCRQTIIEDDVCPLHNLFCTYPNCEK